jgi:hypothetical protein
VGLLFTVENAEAAIEALRCERVEFVGKIAERIGTHC